MSHLYLSVLFYYCCQAFSTTLTLGNFTCARVLQNSLPSTLTKSVPGGKLLLLLVLGKLSAAVEKDYLQLLSSVGGLT